jgi:hypothetical protein
MLDKVDEMIIGGGMAFTFRKELDNMPVRFNPLSKGLSHEIDLKNIDKNLTLTLWLYICTIFVHSSLLFPAIFAIAKGRTC